MFVYKLNIVAQSIKLFIPSHPRIFKSTKATRSFLYHIRFISSPTFASRNSSQSTFTMRFARELLMGAVLPVAMAQWTNSSSAAMPTATDTVPSGAVDGFPLQIEDFVLFGCVSSSAGYPTFELVNTSDDQDLELCAASCKGRNFFGVHENDCYCGDEINSANTSRVELASCDITCPGDDSQFCGGDVSLTRRNQLAARQSISNSIFLTVFVQIDLNIGADVTLTQTATVTDVTTLTTTFVETVTGPSTTEITTVTAVYQCFSGNCYPTGHGDRVIYVFQGYPGEDCYDQVVYLPEPCTCKGGVTYVPHKCTADSCQGKTVYKPEPAKDDGSHKVVYTKEECDGYSCKDADMVYKPVYEPSEKPTVPVYNGGDNNGSDDNGNGNNGSDNNGNGNIGSGNNGSGNNGSDNNGSGDNGSDNTPSTPNTDSGNNGDDTTPGSNGDDTTGSNGDDTVPVYVSGTAKQAVSVFALVAAIAAAAL